MASSGVKTRFMRRAAECGVCRGLISVQGVLDVCSHAFCLDCILQWANIENSCPLCKQRFSKVTTHWNRKCLAENHNKARLRKKQQTAYLIATKSQAAAAHTSVVYDAGQYTLRVIIPWGAEQRANSLFSYLESLLRGVSP